MSALYIPTEAKLHIMIENNVGTRVKRRSSSEAVSSNLPKNSIFAQPKN